MASYGSQSYWDQRYLYTPHSSYEWLQGYHGLRHLLNPIKFAAQTLSISKPHLNERDEPSDSRPESLLSVDNEMTATSSSFPARDKCRVLILGCGNSALGEDMMRDGWTGKIVNVDFSSVVIEQMKHKYNDAFYETMWRQNKIDAEKMDFLCHDITEPLPFDDASFDLIVCKGVFDAVLCSPGSVGNIQQLVKEVARLLAPGHGIFFLVTNGKQDERVVFLEHENDLFFYWQEVDFQSVPVCVQRSSRKNIKKYRSGSQHTKMDYIYICRKRPDQPEQCVEERIDAV